MTTTMDTTPEIYTVSLSPAEFAATQAKIDKINARSAKRGLTGSYRLVGERTERTRRNELGFDVTEVIYKAHLEGEAPKYNGWTFLGRVDVEEAGLVIATAPGVEGIDRESLVPGYCDHCKTNRARRSTYIVRGEDGTQVQVGSSCIKDFLGWTGAFSFISESQARDEAFDVTSSGERTYSVDTVLAASWATITVTGYVKADAWDGTPTKYMVTKVIEGPSSFDRKDARLMATLDEIKTRIPESYARAAEVKAFILSDEFGGSSEYVQNLKVAAAGENVSARSFGLLVSAPQAWIRHNETEADREAKRLAREADKASAVNEYFAPVGEKVEVTVEVKAIRFIEGHYGTTTLYTLRSPEGYTFKWFSSNQALGTDSEGQTFRIKGTVKSHDEYQGTKSTVLTRCKEVSA